MLISRTLVKYFASLCVFAVKRKNLESQNLSILKKMNYIDIIGLFAGTCVTISTIPQILKVWRTKKVKDISLKTFGILTFGILVWVIYGILKEDLPIIITNSVSLCLNLAMVYFIITYEKE